MQFVDLKTQYKVLKKDIDNNISKVLDNSNYILGEQVAELEKRLAEYVGVKHCISCANGTDALMMALKAFKVTENDAVFVPAFTFFSSAEIVSVVGCKLIFVDVDKDTFNMSSEKLEKAIKKVKKENKYIPKVIIPVDLFGLPADYSKISIIAKKYNMFILEDGAQGFGGSINGKKACSFGDISTTSFFPAKPLGCYGDGGAIFTDNDEYADLLKSLRFHGKGNYKYDHVRIGYNSRLDTIQAAILLVKLQAFIDYELTNRIKLANKYDTELKGSVKTPMIPQGYISSYAQYTLILDNEEQRNNLQRYLKEKNIPSMIYYPIPMHKQTVYKDYDFNVNELKVSEELSQKVLSIPMHPYMTDEDADKICNSIKEYLKK